MNIQQRFQAKVFVRMGFEPRTLQLASSWRACSSLQGFAYLQLIKLPITNSRYGNLKNIFKFFNLTSAQVAGIGLFIAALMNAR